jgi:pimeloyl-ACP methyl ester carboxylesterase
MSTFVLVHGAWHGGWCWHKIVARLQARGHTVHAPDMPGHGTDRAAIADVTLETIVAKIGGVIEAAREPVVLVGHSYGGAVITQTAEHYAESIANLVYVAAFLLQDGQSTFDAAADDDTALNGRIAFSGDGRTATVDPAIHREAFYASCSDDDRALASLLLVPEAVAGFQTAVHTTEARFGRIPRDYVECIQDRAISIARQRRMHAAQPCRRVITLETDHSPFFSTPDALTDALTESLRRG